MTIVRLRAGRIRLALLLPVVNVSDAAAAGTMPRMTALSVDGATKVLADAAAVLAFVWLVAPRVQTVL